MPGPVAGAVPARMPSASRRCWAARSASASFVDWDWSSSSEDSSPRISSAEPVAVLVDAVEDPHELVLAEVLQALDRGLLHLRR